VHARQIARQFAARMIAHRNKLAGKAQDALLVQHALHQAAEAVAEQHDDHKKAAATALSHWDGAASERFEKRTGRLGRQLAVTAQASRDAEEIVASTTAALSGGHATARRLVEEYVSRASQVLDAGLAMSGGGSPAALLRAVAAASDLERQYTRESVANLRQVHAELTEAAAGLRRLERHVETGQPGGIADPGTARHRHPETSERARAIVAAARKEIGTGEHPPGSNRNPYGPTAPWCSSFATAMWRRAGVHIPVLPFTGDVYEWGVRHGTAYGRHHLHEARPGDVLLFGTGPSSPATSTHIGIVERVHGDTVTLIEGNSGDQVRRVTHRLSAATFYGGVHP
jgi:peptidoglycan DL-endopeptidase CwlO